MDRAALRKLESSGKVAIATIAENIIPALSIPEEQADWGYLLVRTVNGLVYMSRSRGDMVMIGG